MLRLEGLGQLKNPMNSLGIEPATFGMAYSSALNIGGDIVLRSVG
jgi:hypothetical protein